MRGMFLEVGYLDVVKLDVSMYLGKYYVVCMWQVKQLSLLVIWKANLEREICCLPR